MSLSPDSLTRLQKMQDGYEEGLERANPVPANGKYVALLRKLTNRNVPTQKGDLTVIDVGLRVIGDQVYADYDFIHTIWEGNPMSGAQFASFATAWAGRPVPNIVEAYEILEGQVGNAVFNIQITRNTNSKGQEFPEVVATSKVESHEAAA